MAENQGRAGCGRKLRQGQWWNFCGETDMGQTGPALCKDCGGPFEREDLASLKFGELGGDAEFAIDQLGMIRPDAHGNGSIDHVEFREDCASVDRLGSGGIRRLALGLNRIADWLDARKAREV